MELRASYTIPPSSVATPVREKIVTLQTAMESMPDAMSAEECETEFNGHFFAPGVYGRLMTLPAGMSIVGKIHQHDHITVLVSGTARVVSEFGEETITAPKVWVSPAGTKRAIYAITEMQWLTCHHNPSDTQNLHDIEAEVIADSFEALDTLRLERTGVEL